MRGSAISTRFNMLFNSFHFLIFFVVVFVLYFTIFNKHQWVLLLVSSYYFYMCWKPEYVFLLILSTGVAYLGGLLVEHFPKYGKLTIAGTMIICFGTLFYFKYFNFFLEAVIGGYNFLSGANVPFSPLDIILPIGISFHTFQNIGYVCDVYRKSVKAEKHIGYYALFASYFPQLVAGPIERTANLLPQVKVNHSFTYENGSYGMRWVLIGFFKKVAVADCIAVYVDQCYNNLHGMPKGLSMVIATLLFTIQIYCDFSGYSDIAVGVSRIFGIDLMRNFQSPYFSKSITEFWRRWHVSLSTWFRDNLYIPMGGNRVAFGKQCRNLMLTFVLSGMWHGANWTFFIWGALHGFVLIFEKLIKEIKKQSNRKAKENQTAWIRGLSQMSVTFLIVSLAWIFFRANNLDDAIYVVKNMFTGWDFSVQYVIEAFWSLGFRKISLLMNIFSLCVLFFLDYFNYKEDVAVQLGRCRSWIRWSIYVILGYWVVLAIMLNSQAQNFIYFQF